MSVGCRSALGLRDGSGKENLKVRAMLGNYQDVAQQVGRINWIGSAGWLGGQV